MKTESSKTFLRKALAFLVLFTVIGAIVAFNSFGNIGEYSTFWKVVVYIFASPMFLLIACFALVFLLYIIAVYILLINYLSIKIRSIVFLQVLDDKEVTKHQSMNLTLGHKNSHIFNDTGLDTLEDMFWTPIKSIIKCVSTSTFKNIFIGLAFSAIFIYINYIFFNGNNNELSNQTIREYLFIVIGSVIISFYLNRKDNGLFLKKTKDIKETHSIEYHRAELKRKDFITMFVISYCVILAVYIFIVRYNIFYG